MTPEIELEHRIQRLPQELQDEILEYYLTMPSGTVAVNKNYRPPPQLQINHTTRIQAIQAYYARTTFRLDQRDRESEKMYMRWIVSLLHETFNSTVERIRIDFDTGQTSFDMSEEEMSACRRRAVEAKIYIMCRLRKYYDVFLPSGKLAFRWDF